MTRMTGPDCVVMCNLINTYIHTYVSAFTHERRPYSDSLYPTSFNLDSLPAPKNCVLRKTYDLCFTLRPMACGGFFV